MKETWNDSYGKTALIGFVLIFVLMSMIAFVYPLFGSHKDIVIEEIPEPTGILILDESAHTGYLNNEKYMITFQGFEYHVAVAEGQKPKLDIVFDVEIRVYPNIENVIAYRVDSFDEAVAFLEGHR